MKRFFILGAAVVVAALALAACGGGGGDSSGAAAASNTGMATVSSEDVGGESGVLVDSNGQALYASDQESGGKVLCTAECLTFWTPFTIDHGAPTGDSLPGKLGVVTRPDGDRQVTYDGKLLYSFSEDQSGEVTGDGFQDAFGGQQFTWHVVHAESSSHSSGSSGTSTGPYGY
jgi:predicted lipoprotein with Yx(FWY)xxD motif